MPAYMLFMKAHTILFPRGQQQSQRAALRRITSTLCGLPVRIGPLSSLPTFNLNSFTPSSKGIGLYVPT